MKASLELRGLGLGRFQRDLRFLGVGKYPKVEIFGVGTCPEFEILGSSPSLGLGGFQKLPQALKNERFGGVLLPKLRGFFKGGAPKLEILGVGRFPQNLELLGFVIFPGIVDFGGLDGAQNWRFWGVGTLPQRCEVLGLEPLLNSWGLGVRSCPKI